VLGSVVANGGPAISVTAPDIVLSLLNLAVLNFSGGTNGIEFVNGAQLTVDGCEIYGMSQAGIVMNSASGLLVLKNTVVRDNDAEGILVMLAGSAEMDHVHTLGNGTAGISFRAATKASVTDSVMAGNGSYGLYVDSAFGNIAVTVERSVIRGSMVPVAATSLGAGSVVQLTLRENSISISGPVVSPAIYVSAISSVTGVTLQDNVIEHGASGVMFNGTTVMSVQTTGDNTFVFNTSDVISGSLTPLSYQ